MRAWAVLALLALCACSPKPPAPSASTALDCSQPFETLKAAIIAMPALVPAPKDSAQPYRFFSSADGKTSYLFTEPGAPGHPAVMMQRAVDGTVKTTGCPYGDRASYDQLMAYLDSLKSWRR